MPKSLQKYNFCIKIDIWHITLSIKGQIEPQTNTLASLWLLFLLFCLENKHTFHSTDHDFLHRSHFPFTIYIFFVLFKASQCNFCWTALTAPASDNYGVQLNFLTFPSILCSEPSLWDWTTAVWNRQKYVIMDDETAFILEQWHTVMTMQNKTRYPWHLNASSECGHSQKTTGTAAGSLLAVRLHHHSSFSGCVAIGCLSSIAVTCQSCCSGRLCLLA